MSASVCTPTTWRLRRWAWSVLYFGLVLTPTVYSGRPSNELEETNFIDDSLHQEKQDRLPYDETYAINTDDIFQELIVKPSTYLAKLPSKFSKNATSQAVLKGGQKLLSGLDPWRDKRGALHLAGIIKCATNCNPLSFKGYGCYCGFLGDGQPMDGIDTCCKMHDWCYTTTSCMGLDWDLPYFVPFKWKCNGGSPYCIPGKTKKSDRNSCSHQLCECDREFGMCLQKYLPCPTTKALCKSKQRLWQNVLMGFGSGKGVHKTHKHHDKHKHQKHKHHHKHVDHSSERFIQHDDIHGQPHRFKPSPLINIPRPFYPYKGLRLNFGK